MIRGMRSAVPFVVADPVRYPGLDAEGHTQEDIACFNDPNCDQHQRLIQLLHEDATGTGRGWLPCGSDGVPCGPEQPSGSTSGFLIWGAVAVLAAYVLGSRRR